MIFLLDKLIKTTNNFTKAHGQIQCNRGEQEEQVKKILSSNGYTFKDISSKPSRAQIIYDKN